MIINISLGDGRIIALLGRVAQSEAGEKGGGVEIEKEESRETAKE